LNPSEFVENQATDAGMTADDNADIYDLKDELRNSFLE
jgi:hypothetical protein